MINTFDIDKNFWTTHPDMKVVDPFKSIYEDDKSKKKVDSSLLMWFVVLCYDRESKYYRLPAEERHEIIGLDYCGDAKYYDKNKVVLDASILMYIKLQYSPMEQQMFALERTLAKRASVLEDIEYDLDNFEKVDKMVTGTYKVWQDYKNILDEMSKEGNEGTAKGGAVESLND